MQKMFLAFTSLAVLLAGCSLTNEGKLIEPPLPTFPTPYTCQGVEFSQADNGKTLQVQKGRHLVFVAESNPTTGYDWFARGYKESLLVHDPDQDEYSSSSSLVGAGGTLRLCLTAVAAGDSPLELLYERPWESGTVEPLKKVTVTVVIRQ